LTALGVNVSTDGTCPGFVAVTSGDLNLGPLQNNGGPTETQALIPPSAAIDIVTDCTFINGDPVLEDQRGLVRPPNNCDAGAYEFGAMTFAVNVPTLSEWGVIITTLFLGLIALIYLNRNRKLAK